MEFENMCEAAARGLKKENCCLASECKLDCRLLGGYMQCNDGTGPLYFNNINDAERYGYPEETYDCHTIDQVPDCAKTGRVVCQGDLWFVNLCVAEKPWMK